MEIQEIKQKLGILEALDHYGLKPDKNQMLCCPFHKDKTPSLQIYPKTDTFCCFSSNCTAGTGDVIRFIELKEKCTKHEAILKAKELISPGQKPQTKPLELSRIAVLTKFWQEAKEAFKKNQNPKDYCKERGLDPEKLEIGYAAENYHRYWNPQLKEAASNIGLVKKLPDGRYSTHFKNTILFAHKNKEGQIIDLYGRSISNEKDQRHYYLPGKHQGLYPSYPRENTQRLILAESHIDTATLQLALNIPALTLLTCYGTNGFTEEHKEAIESLKALEEVIIFFDGDEAGRKGADKIKEEITTINKEVKITIVNTPEGEDINSLAQSHEAEIFTHLIGNNTEPKESLSFSTEEIKPEVKETPEPPKEREQLNLFTPPKSKLNTTNPDQITYQQGHLQITILGGISLQNLDRLRVTLKINLVPQLSPLHSLRHNIDLYQDDALQKLVRRAAEKLETSTGQISQALAELTEELERYRLERIESLKEHTVKKKILSLKELQEAEGYLRSPNLLERTRADLAKTGIVGEDLNALLLYFAMTSRKAEDPVSVICLSGSGMGKSYLQEKVAECMPEEDKIENTQFTENSFYYFKREEIKGKIFLIEDLDGAEAVLYPIRELQSKKRISKTVTLKDSKGNLRTYTLVVEGPVTVVAATTREKVYEDNANRSLLIYLDQSKNQDTKIMDYQKALRAGIINKEEEQATQEKLRNVQRLLRPLKVINPYAPLIDLPEEIFKPRRTIGLLLSFIEAITLYHQYQTKEVYPERSEGTGSIYTEPEHIEWAFKLLKETLFRKSDELSGATRSFFEGLKNHLKKEKKTSFYCQDIRKPLNQSPRNLQRYLYELLQYNYVKIIGGNRYRKGYEYEIIAYNDYQTLKSSIDKKLEEVMIKIKAKKEESKPVRQSATKAPLSHSKPEVSTV